MSWNTPFQVISVQPKKPQSQFLALGKLNSLDFRRINNFTPLSAAHRKIEICIRAAGHHCRGAEINVILF